MAQREHPTIHIKEEVPIGSLEIQFSVKDAYEKTSLIRKAGKGL